MVLATRRAAIPAARAAIPAPRAAVAAPRAARGDRRLIEEAVALWKASRYDGGSHLTDLTGRGRDARLGSTTGADTNDPLFLPFTGEKHAYLPGIAGNYLSTPHSAALAIPGDITVDIKVALDDWTPGTTQSLVGKMGSGTARSWRLDLGVTGTLAFYTSVDGSAVTSGFLSNASVSATDGAVKWIRASLDVDNGGGNRDCKFYTSDDGVTWTQLGTTVTAGGATTLFNATTAPVEIGSIFTGTIQPSTGKFYRVRIYNSYLQTSGGTPVFDANLANATEPFATFVESSANGATVTFNRTASGRKLAVVDRPLFLFGTDDYMEVASHADLSTIAAGDSFTVVVAFRKYGTIAATNSAIVSNRAVTGVGAGWSVYVALNTELLAGRVADGAVSPIAHTAGAIPSGVAQVGGLMRSVALDVVSAFRGTASVAGTDTTTAALTNAGPVFIGKSTVGEFFDGELIGAAVFRRALSDAEIARLGEELLA